MPMVFLAQVPRTLLHPAVLGIPRHAMCFGVERHMFRDPESCC